jgi:hypothetical protein
MMFRIIQGRLTHRSTVTAIPKKSDTTPSTILSTSFSNTGIQINITFQHWDPAIQLAFPLDACGNAEYTTLPVSI